jgi:penicillin-binding protein 1C
VDAPLWESPSVRFDRADGRTYALLTEGEHRLVVRDPATGRRAETWIRVKSF